MKIKSIKILEEKEHTYDIEVDDVHHYLLSNGCVSHNSSVITNSTNGIEPIRGYITTKKSKQGLIRVVVPEYMKLKNKYQLAFDIESNKGITNIHGVITKWIDQSISANHYYDITKFSNNEIPMSIIVKDLLYAYKMGVKTLYYANTNDDKSDDFSKELDKIGMKKEEDNIDDDMSCAGGACTI